MVLFRVDKVIVVTLLEAAKMTMEQIGVQRMERADQVVDDSRRLVSLYGELRRLKDYLQRCVGAFRDRVELDLAEEDLPLLAACCRRGAEISDQRLGACTDMRERSLIQSKRDMLLDWAVELAAEPLLELPLPSLTTALSPAMRGLRMRLSQKFAKKTLIGEHNPYKDQLRPMESDLAGPIPPSTPVVDPEPEPASWPSMRATPSSVAAASPSAPPLHSPFVPPVREVHPASAVQPMVVEEETPISGTARLLEVMSIRDPRLRAMMALDLRALERAIGANDYRLAAVHLTSVLEGAVIDHAIPRTLELGLSGMPDTWNPQDVLLRVFGDNCLPRDRAAAHHVFAARTLIHPALQLKAPIVVTALGFRKHMEFVAHALRVMGYTS